MPEREGSAMDLLMNYGWVLVVLVGGISALSYFQVFSLSGGNSLTGAVVDHSSLNQAASTGWLLFLGLLCCAMFFYFKFFHFRD